MNLADQHPAGATWLLGGATALATLAFLALGSWQLERRAWKLQLIAAVERRVQAQPAPLPALPAHADRSTFEYLRVRVRGEYLARPPTLTQAVTRLGSGFWVLQPFRTDAGDVLFVNRGFVAGPRATAPPPPPAGQVELTGLLRPDEPRGGFLRRNDPAGGRWYSRDVAAMAEQAGLASVPPWFVDAEATVPGEAQPVGGLTVVQFRNAHLSYALTWFTLAALGALGTGLVLRDAARQRRAARATAGATC